MKRSAEYLAAYERGWKSGQSASYRKIEAADRRDEPGGWYDGYADASDGRERGHLIDCSAHHNGPGGCGQDGAMS